MKFGVGVLGATGFIGVPYRKEIRESPADATLVALSARRPGLLAAAANEDGAALAVSDWRRVVEHPDVNLVVICTPDSLHHEAVMACAELGKHVVCEKPVATDAGQALEMYEAAHRAGIASFVPFWTRYVPAFVRARDLIRSGAIGDVRAVIYRWHNPRPANMPFTWRDDVSVSSAGSIADVGSHACDSLRRLLGVEPTRVLACAAVLTPPKPDVGEVNLAEAIALGNSAKASPERTRQGTAPDYASIAFELPGGVAGTLLLSHATYLRKGLAPDVELHGTTGSLAIDRVRSTIGIVRPGEDRPETEIVPDPGPVNRFANYVFPALRAQLAGGPSEHPTLEDGYRVQRFTDAAARSARRECWETV